MGGANGTRMILLSTPDDYDTVSCEPVYGLSPELFFFDNTTGLVSPDMILSDADSILYYGASFSPDNSKLYLSCAWYGYFGNGSSYIHQFDLNAGSAAAVVSSRTLVNDSASSLYPGAMQLAKDGKIYVANDYSQYVGAITIPNASGLLRNYIDNAVLLAGWDECGISLPNFPESYFATTCFKNIFFC